MVVDRLIKARPQIRQDLFDLTRKRQLRFKSLAIEFRSRYLIFPQHRSRGVNPADAAVVRPGLLSAFGRFGKRDMHSALVGGFRENLKNAATLDVLVATILCACCDETGRSG